MTPYIWQANSDDDRFHVGVERTGGATARLIVCDMAKPNSDEIYNEEVGLSYGARFGPDVQDVEAWTRMATAAIDNYLEKNDGS
jgi:hypothetical protein